MIRKFPLFRSEWKKDYLCRWCTVSNFLQWIFRKIRVLTIQQKNPVESEMEHFFFVLEKSVWKL